MFYIKVSWSSVIHTKEINFGILSCMSSVHYLLNLIPK